MLFALTMRIAELVPKAREIPDDGLRIAKDTLKDSAPLQYEARKEMHAALTDTPEIVDMSRALSVVTPECKTANWSRNSGLLLNNLASVAREPESPRLVGCAGSLKRTCLSLQFGEMQGGFAKLQGQRRLIPGEGPRISMGWIGLSLIQEAGRPSFHNREGRFRNTAPVFFGDIHAAQFTVRFWAPSGHRRMAR